MEVFVEVVSLKVVGDLDGVFDFKELFVEVGDICNKVSEKRVGVEP